MERISRLVFAFVSLAALFTIMPVRGDEAFGEHMRVYAQEYARTLNTRERIKTANRFFDYLYRKEYIDTPIAFEAGSHIDSVDVNVYYYIAEWYYGEGAYREAADYCTRAAERCTDHVDKNSKGDVYSLLGAAYFRLSEFDKAADALHVCYEIDSKSGNYDQLSSTLNNIASVFVAAGKPQEAEKYVMEAIAANSLTDNLARRAVLFGTASEMYRATGDDEQSLAYALKALEIERQRGDSARIGVRLSQVANAQLGMARIEDARRSLEEAMPLLEKAGNTHSLGICMNQMGDILTSKGKPKEASDYYRKAAKIFFDQRDMYNEQHSREGLYKVLKEQSPGEAMLHLERAKQLHDSIYQQETTEAISRYNAIYYNDILEEEKAHVQREKVFVIIATCMAIVLLLGVLCLGAWYTYRRHRLHKQQYEQDLHSLEGRYNKVHTLYRHVVADTMQNNPDLTADDRDFLTHLDKVIDEESEKGISDIGTIASDMHINSVTLRRRLQQIAAITPQAYILQVRMQKAKFLLQNYRDITVADVAYKCGYAQLANFTRAFTRFYGVTPSEARGQKQDSNLPPPASE